MNIIFNNKYFREWYIEIYIFGGESKSDVFYVNDNSEELEYKMKVFKKNNLNMLEIGIYFNTLNMEHTDNFYY